MWSLMLMYYFVTGELTTCIWLQIWPWNLSIFLWIFPLFITLIYPLYSICFFIMYLLYFSFVIFRLIHFYKNPNSLESGFTALYIIFNELCEYLSFSLIIRCVNRLCEHRLLKISFQSLGHLFQYFCCEMILLTILAKYQGAIEIWSTLLVT